MFVGGFAVSVAIKYINASKLLLEVLLFLVLTECLRLISNFLHFKIMTAIIPEASYTAFIFYHLLLFWD